MSGWQPIETAPWDTAVLVFIPDSAICEFEIAHRSADDPDGDWYSYIHLGGPIDVAPTHWQPLPAPPVSA